MNAHAPISVAADALALAANNQAILRALLPGPIAGDAQVAKAADVPGKNVGRQLKLLADHQLAGKGDDGWALLPAGVTALAAIDLAEGRIGAPTAAAIVAPAPNADPSALLLLHHHIRPNPLQPRKIDLDRPKDRLELDQLKASIAADLALGGPGVLQNLTVYPADADGIHDLFAGERRWLAVGELIAEGIWPSDRPLRAIQRDSSAGLTAFIALVENGQRQNLALIEEARGYAALIEDTGWSARHAALQTGRDPRTVQEMLKVLREASADDIARHEASPETYTWEDLRASVRKPSEGEGEGGADPNQLDIEDAAAGQLPYELTNHDRSLLDYKAGHCRALKPRGLLMLVELADKYLRDPAREGRYTRVAKEHPGADSAFVMAGAGFTWRDDHGLATIAHASLEWLRVNGLLTVTGDRAEILRSARERAGVSAERIAAAEDADTYITEWLDPSWAPPTPATGKPPLLTPSGSGSAQPPKPIPEPADRELSSTEELALLELAHSSARSVADGRDHNGAWTIARKYWLHAEASELKAMGLIAFSHLFPKDGPHVGLLPRGRQKLEATFGPLDWSATPAALDLIEKHLVTARDACGLSGAGWALATAYVTPWLNEAREEGAAAVSPSEIVNAMGEGDDDFGKSNDDLDDEEYVTAELLLRDVVRQADRSDGINAPPLFQRAGIVFPLKIDRESRAICGADGQLVLDLVGHGDLAEDLVRARTILVLTALNAFADLAAVQPSKDQPKEKTAAEPAVPIRRSITPSTITCLEDGRQMASIALHVRSAYGLTPDGYRAKWGLPRDYPLVAPNPGKFLSDDMKALGIDVWSFTQEDDQDGEGGE